MSLQLLRREEMIITIEMMMMMKMTMMDPNPVQLKVSSYLMFI